MLTPEQIAVIRERCEAATPDWTYSRCMEGYRITSSRERIIGQINSGIEDADFIAHARQDIPPLLDALEEAEELIEVNEQHEAAMMENYNDACAERDQYKRRAEAMERLLKAKQPCDYCVRMKHRAKIEFSLPCNIDPDNPCIKCKELSLWQFDEARFAEVRG